MNRDRKDLSLLDQAYLLAKNAQTPASHAQAEATLQAKFPKSPVEAVLEAYRKGVELVEKCREIGEVARRDKLSDPQALQLLAERHPGFSANIYGDALTQGWFQSRQATEVAP